MNYGLLVHWECLQPTAASLYNRLPKALFWSFFLLNINCFLGFPIIDFTFTYEQSDTNYVNKLYWSCFNSANNAVHNRFLWIKLIGNQLIIFFLEKLFISKMAMLAISLDRLLWSFDQLALGICSRGAPIDRSPQWLTGICGGRYSDMWHFRLWQSTPISQKLVLFHLYYGMAPCCKIPSVLINLSR
jgi:hypothetical protein